MLNSENGLRILPVTALPEVRQGDDLARLISDAAKLEDYDVLVITQKVISKAEGRTHFLDEDDEAGFEELVLRESRRVLRQRGPLRITETRHGFVCANAGIDRSNSELGTVTLLPRDPDLSARRIRQRIRHFVSKNVAVVVTDTFGRTWRNGVVDVAIGSAGVACVVDLRGSMDSHGRILNATEVCIADELAAAADLVKPKDGNIPAVIIRGLRRDYFRDSSVSKEIVRSPSDDLFR